ncbi:MAG: HAMP domain-containing protein [SAR202 cluster bacterium]|nr:hypothetical protein [Chloroflexota bacterium]MQG58349.1 HAMP domain-containing protein [SAR202 cluster bacterium]MQG69466.1 HAMP domain-containing protein [SAR202 cluster bacterium]HAL46850.1 hypothetical protein [Dehalococcoidia bacterium]
MCPKGVAPVRFIRSLQGKVLLSAFIPGALILAIVAVIALVAYEQVARRMVEQRDAELARISAARLRADLTQYTSSLDRVARGMRMDFLYPQQVGATMDIAWGGTEPLLFAFDAGVAVYDAEGLVVWAPLHSALRRQQGFPLPEVFADDRFRDGVFISDVFNDGVTGEDSILISAPIVSGGSEFRGVVAGIATIDDSPMISAYSGALDVRPGPDGLAYLVDGAGRVIYHGQFGLTNRDLSAFAPVASVMNGGQGSLISEDEAGQVVVSGYAPVPGAAWGVVTQERWANVIEPIRSASTNVVRLLLLGGAVTIGVVWFLIRRSLLPIVALNQSARRIAGGDFEHTFSTNTRDEVQELADQFNIMASALKASYAELEDRVALRTGELRDSEQRLRAIVAGAPVMMLATDREGTFTLSEGTGMEAIGLASGAWVGESILESTV